MANVQLPHQYPIQRPKKRSRNPAQWRQNTLKKARIKGSVHINPSGDVIGAKTRQANQCQCEPSCIDKFTDQEMDAIFEGYRNLSAHEEQTLFLRSCVIKSNDQSNAFSNIYCLDSGNVSIQVCQKFLLGLLNIKRSRLRNKVLNTTVPVTDGRGKHMNHRHVHPDAILGVRNFLSALNPRESHYSRKENPYRTYLESNLSISSLYNEFICQCPNFSPTAVLQPHEEPKIMRKSEFSKIFNSEFNISFGYPRSDICETCQQNVVLQKKAEFEQDQVKSTELAEEHEFHLLEAQEFYKAMSKRVIDQFDNATACICFDFEKNLPIPVTNVTKEFFSRQLWIYNFGIHNLRNDQCHMYMFSETYCQKGPNEVISALKHYIQNYIPLDKTKLKIFCDNSGGQNKNKYVVAYLSSLGGRFQEVVLSFPVVGHSRMPCDRDFAKVEKFKKKTDKFYFPSDWTNLVRRSQGSHPFHIVYLEHPLTDDLCDDGTPIATVYDFKSVLDPLLKPPTGIMSMKGFKFDNTGSIRSRIETSGGYTSVFVVRKAQVSIGLLQQVITQAPGAYQDFLPISKQKYNDVQSLLKNFVIPPEKTFYSTIPCEL